MGNNGATWNRSIVVCTPLITVQQSVTVERIQNDMHLAKTQGADVVEVRLDLITDFQPRRDLQIILTNKPLPVFILYRSKSEGGLYDGDENTRLETLQLALEFGADFIDVELKAASHLKSIVENKRNDGKIIVSCFVDGIIPPREELRQLVAFMQATGADIIKLVTNAADITQVTRIFSLLPHCQAASHLKSIVENKRNDGKIIVSCFVDGIIPPREELRQLVAFMQATGADIIKLVTNAADITQVTRIFSLLPHCQVPFIAYSVGERGLISHLLCPKFGGFFVCGSLARNPVPGLPSLDSLREAYKLEHVNADTKVFGLISKPVSHSKGPILHNPTFRHVNYNGIYVPMFVDDLKKFFSIYSSPDFAGFSVGIPYKEEVVRFCDEVHPLAQSIGAVNTIIRRPSDGKLIGYNTDCEASITAIEDALIEHGCNDGGASSDSPIAGRLFVLVGAGGAGKALAFGAKSRGARVVVFDIDFDRAKSLACAVFGEVMPYKDLVNFQPEKGAILANATPIGMHPSTDRIPVAEATLGDYRLVFDAVYTPRRTRLLKEADAAGAITVSGVEMFLRQAAGQFNLFTGLTAPEEFMREIVLSKF